ncbi:DUF262 domain-containing protein, partial [Alistipes putredinis]|uniref:DUF262 domain-containing protein n=1 Tax=Alistipes putredinis TaxID=28117 RepID=UPI00247FA91B
FLSANILKILGVFAENQNDFKEFCKRKKEEGEFYCLQPIVVKKKSWTKVENGQTISIDGYEVIDGQQRLTTLYILLKCVEFVRKVLFRKFEMYSIKYETRLEFDSQRFLENIDTPSEDANSFIDFYYMRMVYESMSEWMEKNDEYQNDIVSALLAQKIDDITGIDKANNIRVIWYEVTDEEKATTIDIFTRLNIGKIPLTNAELIKALLLRRSNFSTSEASMKQLQISSEWNQIEQRLQNDSFWHFLCRTSWPFKYDNRIEFIFDLMKGRSVDSEFYFTFNAFNKELEKLADNPVCTTEQAKIECVWQEVKRTFQTFEEWYEDRTLYHYIGFLIEYGADINELMRKSLEMNKTEFLTDYIKGNKLKGLMRGIKLSDLSYGDKEVKQVLLLFNILTVLQSNKSDMRFPFSKYKKEKWDIEHISSQTDKRINDDGRRLEWIYDMLEFLVGSTEAEEVSAYVDSLKQEIQKIESKEKDKDIAKSKVNSKKGELVLINSIVALHSNSQKGKINDAEFDECFDAVQKYYGEDKLEDKDNIRNLTLLDAQTNRGYGNSFFPIKRKWIISNDSQGIFVPIVTKNVFLKYYTKKGNNLMVWDKTDAEDYITAMEQALNEYLKQE